MDRSAKEAEFTAFVAARSHTLLRFACLLTGDLHDGEDLLQAALAKAFLAWPRIRSHEGAESYVRQALITTNISHWRRHRNREVVGGPMVDRPHDAETRGVEDRLSLWPHIRALPRRQRTVIVLRYYEDLTEVETAHLMRCSVGTVKSYNARALHTLKSALATSSATSPQERST